MSSRCGCCRPVQELVPEGHRAHLVRELVRESLDLSAIFKAYRRKQGSPPFNPAMMTALLLYAYTQGVFSSRKIAAACEERLDSPLGGLLRIFLVLLASLRLSSRLRLERRLGFPDLLEALLLPDDVLRQLVAPPISAVLHIFGPVVALRLRQPALDLGCQLRLDLAGVERAAGNLATARSVFDGLFASFAEQTSPGPANGENPRRGDCSREHRIVLELESGRGPQGTAPYYRGHEGPQRDVYALALTLAELLTGQPPDHDVDLASKRIPPALARVLESALRTDALPTMDAFHTALREADVQPPDEAEAIRRQYVARVDLPSTTPPPRRRRASVHAAV